MARARWQTGRWRGDGGQQASRGFDLGRGHKGPDGHGGGVELVGAKATLPWMTRATTADVGEARAGVAVHEHQVGQLATLDAAELLCAVAVLGAVPGADAQHLGTGMPASHTAPARALHGKTGRWRRCRPRVGCRRRGRRAPGPSSPSRTRRKRASITSLTSSGCQRARCMLAERSGPRNGGGVAQVHGALALQYMASEG